MPREAHYSDGPSPLSELTSQPHFEAGWALMNNLEAFATFGLHDAIGQRLGRGAFGTAYRIDAFGESVLKLTRDPTEVQAACLLRGKTTRRVVDIYDVWSIRNSMGNSGDLRPWYLIHRDYLSVLGKRDKHLVEHIFMLYDEVELDLVIPRSAKQYATLSKWRGYLRDSLADGPTVDEDGALMAVGVTGKAVARAMQLLLQIGEAVDEMHRMGIDWEDIHSDNIMRDRSGRLVIGDIGWGIVHDEFDEEVPSLTPDAVQRHLAGRAETGE